MMTHPFYNNYVLYSPRLGKRAVSIHTLHDSNEDWQDWHIHRLTYERGTKYVKKPTDTDCDYVNNYYKLKISASPTIFSKSGWYSSSVHNPLPLNDISFKNYLCDQYSDQLIFHNDVKVRCMRAYQTWCKDEIDTFIKDSDKNVRISAFINVVSDIFNIYFSYDYRLEMLEKIRLDPEHHKSIQIYPISQDPSQCEIYFDMPTGIWKLLGLREGYDNSPCFVFDDPLRVINRVFYNLFGWDDSITLRLDGSQQDRKGVTCIEDY